MINIKRYGLGLGLGLKGGNLPVNWIKYWSGKYPTLLTISNLTTTTAKLDWTNNGSADFDNIIVDHSIDGLTYTQFASISKTAITYNATGLADGEHHYFRVFYQKGSSTSLVSNVVDDYTIPIAPSVMTLVGYTDTEIDVGWTMNSAACDGSKVYMSTDNVTFTLKGTVAGQTATYRAGSLTANTLYYFYVVSYKSTKESSATTTASKLSLSILSWTPTGTGAAVQAINLHSNAIQTIRITSGPGRFYTDAGGTTGESSSKTLVAGHNLFYFKSNHASTVTYGAWNQRIIYQVSGPFYYNNGIDSPTNAPLIAYDMSKFDPAVLTVHHITGKNSIFGSIAELTTMWYHQNVGTGTTQTPTGSIAALINLTVFSCYGANTITGSINALNKVTSLSNHSASNDTIFTGDFTGMTAATSLFLFNGTKHEVTGDIGGAGNAAWIYGMAELRLSSCRVTTYTAGSNFSNVRFEVTANAGYGWDQTEISNIFINMNNSAVGPTSKPINILGANASMADYNQGGIWGDFSGTATPSALATAYKALIRTRGNVLTVNGITAPGASGDGTGFPAGFGNWYRS